MSIKFGADHVPRPGILWNGHDEEKLSFDGGRVRNKKVNPKKLKGIQEKIMTHYGFQGSEE